jgi:hypothetical protein
MSTLAQTERASSRRSRVGIILTALGTLVVVAVAVVVVLLVLPGSSTTTTQTHQSAIHQSAMEQPALSWPLIQYHGTGAAPPPAQVQSPPARPGTQPYARHVQGLTPVR